MCDVMGIDNVGLVAIGLGGICIPYTLSFTITPKKFWSWYTNFVVRCISLLAIGISVIGIIMWYNGKPIVNEDISQVLNIFESGAVLFLILFVIMAVYEEEFIRVVNQQSKEKLVDKEAGLRSELKRKREEEKQIDQSEVSVQTRKGVTLNYQPTT